MQARRGSAAETKSAILEAARRLFAEQDIASVSIRDIASAAGVSHGLVQRYFGSREQMLEAIVRQEVAAYHTTALPLPAADEHDWQQLREVLKAGWPHFQNFAVVVARAEMAGLSPERMLDPDTATPAARLAATITALRGDTSSESEAEARLASAYVTAALFAFATMGPWLMASVGLEDMDEASMVDTIIDSSVILIRGTSPTQL